MVSIVLVDDENDALEALEWKLINYIEKVSITKCNSPINAIKVIENLKPDIVFLDIQMPEMDGFEVCRRLKSDETTRDIPIIFLSALNEPRNIIKGFESGGADYVSKPFNSIELLARVHTHISLKNAYNKLKEKQQQTREFYNFITHELRTPMTVIEPHIRFLKNVTNRSCSHLDYDVCI